MKSAPLLLLANLISFIFLFIIFKFDFSFDSIDSSFIVLIGCIESRFNKAKFVIKPSFGFK